MSSGEWDLRALKALEEEEQKEFLALSQKNLFEPPLPTGAPENGGVGNFANSNGSSGGKPALAYAQLHPHLLKLPTIDECQLIAAQRQSAGSVASSARLKFTRALSLSAHSLSPRVGAGSGGFGKKLKARLVGAKSSGSLSPSRHSHSYSVSPVYTPPPMRRCATLHHTQPVRKTFKTLQQLERQKRQSNSNSNTPHAGAGATLHPQLQRIVGTNKTYWKYGANSTAASIIGQRARLQQQQQQLQQQQQQQSELESNNSDEPNAELFDSEALDSATETGSCSVPLPPADSNELLRLSMMLTAASSAVTGAATAAATAAAATGGNSRRYQPQSDVEDETVAYEAFHRPKSFERSLLRGGSLTVTAHESRSHSPSPSPSRSRAIQSTNGVRIFKSTSLDVAGVAAGAVEYQQQQQHQQQQHQQHQQQLPQQQQIIGQPRAMMSLTTATNQLVEHQTNEAHYRDRDRERDRDRDREREREREQVKYHQDLSVACYGHDAALGGATIDDELEQHIKHCSCSCNHMGYGNSMDYQFCAPESSLFVCDETIPAGNAATASNYNLRIVQRGVYAIIEANVKSMGYHDHWKHLLKVCSEMHTAAFSKKFLLYTNLGISISLSMLGDTLEQSYERFTNQIVGWDRTRTLRMGISGFTVGIVCHFWYQYLDYIYPKRTVKAVIHKILLDQFICSPFYISVFFLTMGLLEDKPWSEVRQEIEDKAWTLYKAEWTVWPAAQFINFFLITPKYRVFYDNIVSLGYDVYTSRVKYSKSDNTKK